ncbi:hypothetical protein [Tsukamurella tyrosinosolvens]|nr:hypothetical protein [Tsukamurella tyrosinosolvens]
MLHGVGVNWAHLDPQLKNGTFIHPGGETSCVRADYSQLEQWIEDARTPESAEVAAA